MVATNVSLEVRARRIDRENLFKHKVVAILAEVDRGTTLDNALRINGINASKELCAAESAQIEDAKNVYSPNAIFDIQVQIEVLKTLQKRMEIQPPCTQKS